MLRLRPMQAMVLTVLAILLICTIGTYADDRLKSISDHWMNDKVFWKVTTGHHSWNSYNTHSWHRVFVKNDSTIYNLTVEFWWEHEVVYVDEDHDPETDATSGSFSVSTKTGVNPASGSRKGWLGPDVSLDEGRYKLISRTKVNITNDKKPRPQTMGAKTVTKTTPFRIE